MRPSYTLGKAGLFRANPNASTYNANRHYHPTAGTPRTDTGTVDVAAAVSITGVKYTGVDGVSQFIQLFYEDIPTGQRRPIVIAAQSSVAIVQEAIHRVVSSHEVDSIVSVTKAGSVLTFTHTGSGTLSAIVVDGADATLSRADVAGVGIAQVLDVEGFEETEKTEYSSLEDDADFEETNEPEYLG